MNQELTILLNLCTGKHVEASPFRGITNQRRSLAPYRQSVLRENYALSILSSTAASLLIVIAAFKLWPVRTNQVDFVVASADHSRELVLLDDVRPTMQSTIHIPPAPRTPIPIYTTNDVVLEPDELEMSSIDTLPVISGGDPSSLSELNPGLIGLAESAGAAITSPRPVRFVEPAYTRNARKDKVRAEIVVEVLVDDTGSVTDSRVVQRYLLSKNGSSKEPVDLVGYGLEESALAAAEQWRFLPAYWNGKPVEGSITLTFRFGI